MNCNNFFIKMFTAHSGLSSKRVCGVLGWIVCIGILIYCTIASVQAPVITDTFLLCIMGLLGIDSVTGIFRNKVKNTNTLNRYDKNDDYKDNNYDYDNNDDYYSNNNDNYSDHNNKNKKKKKNNKYEDNNSNIDIYGDININKD